MKRLLAGLVVLALISTNACGKEEDWYPSSETLSISFQSTEGGTRLQRSFQLPIDKEFEVECTIENSSPHTVDLCAVLFIDYRQVAFEWNGSARQITHLFSLKQGQKEIYFMRTPPLTEGYHEFMLTFLSHPFYRSTNPDWRRLSRWARWYWRANLYVGDAALPSKEFPLYGEGTGNSSLSALVSISPEPVTEATWRWCEQKVKANERVDYFVNVSNVEEEEEAFALICLLDYRQIPANLDTDELVTFGILPGLTQANVSASFQVSQEAIHELIVMCVRQPYTELEKPLGTLAYPGHVDSSNRTLIIVEDTDGG